MTGPFRTLVFCTSYLAGPGDWAARYGRWLAHHAALPFERPLLCLIDDGSPHVPDADIAMAVDASQAPPASPSLPLFMHFENRLGRSAVDAYPGWWRSFLFSIAVARHYRCTKIVHVESDAYVLSARMVEFINRQQQGWTAFWCPKYAFPETAIQVICEDQFAALQVMWDMGWDRYAGKLAERELPFTQVEKSLHGNRYAEFRRDIPGYADFAAQVVPQQDVWFR